MSTLEIKGELHGIIANLNDEKKLMKCYEYINSLISKNSNEDFWDDFTDEQIKEFDEALEEAENGKNLISNEEVFKKYKK